MECKNCEHYKIEIVSIIGPDNIDTDLGIRIHKCYKLINYLITKDEYTNSKYSGPTGTLGFTEIFKYSGRYDLHRALLPLPIIEEVETPKWCPLNK